METELNFECVDCEEFLYESSSCDYCEKSICLDCCHYTYECDLILCKDCYENNDFMKCDCCDSIISKEDQEDAKFVVSDRILRVDWNFKKMKVSQTAAWSNFDFVCDECLFRQDNYDCCHKCEEYFDTKKCDISLKENNLCYHCDYKQKIMAMMTLNRINMICTDIKRSIVEYL